jgi:hypothetical protein
LRSEAYNDIEFVNNRGSLPKGASQITFPFDGFKISNDADGKPLRILNVSILCGGRLHADLEGSIALPVFPRGTFVKAAPAFELYSSMSAVHMERGKIGKVSIGVHPQGGFSEVLDVTIEGLPEGIVAQSVPRSMSSRMVGELTWDFMVAPNVPSVT